MELSYVSRSPWTKRAPSESLYEVAVPPVSGTDVAGLVPLQVSSKQVDNAVAAAMRRDAWGAGEVMLLLALPVAAFALTLRFMGQGRPDTSREEP